MEQPLFTINSTFSEEEVVRFNKYVTLHMSHYVRNVVICNIILLLFTVGTIVNDITSEDFPISSIMMFSVCFISIQLPDFRASFNFFHDFGY